VGAYPKTPPKNPKNPKKNLIAFLPFLTSKKRKNLDKNNLKNFLRLFWDVLTNKERKKFLTKNILKAFFMTVFGRFSPIKNVKKFWSKIV
jgi:hypothetical protein